MFKNLISASNRFYEDQALIFMTFGGFGRYVLSILNAEFRRLGIPEDKVNFLAFDTYGRPRSASVLPCISRRLPDPALRILPRLSGETGAA